MVMASSGGLGQVDGRHGDSVGGGHLAGFVPQENGPVIAHDIVKDGFNRGLGLLRHLRQGVRR